MLKDTYQKLCRGIRSLGSYSLEKKYDLTLSLYADGQTDTPECSHHFAGHSRHNLLKLTALIVLLCAAVATICMLFGCCKGKKRA